jgi:hypothetical protein
MMHQHRGIAMQREYIIALVVGVFSISNAAEIASGTNTINVKNLSDVQARESVFDWTQEAFGKSTKNHLHSERSITVRNFLLPHP